MRYLAIGLLLASACQFDGRSGQSFAPDATGNEVDASGDVPDGTTGVADAMVSGCPWNPTSLFVPCDDIVEVAGADSFSIGGNNNYEYNTNTGAMRLIGSSTPILVPTQDLLIEGVLVPAIVVGKFTIGDGATLRAVGTNPLLIVSWSEIRVAGTIDVSSGVGETGAGSGDSNCNLAGNGGDGGLGGSGGGGGGYGAVGGAGGRAQSGSLAGGLAGGIHGSAPNTLRGGCPGGNGGGGFNPNDESLGGNGGGAVALVAKSELSVTGIIQAGGQGGTNSIGFHNGGGGGGSGGMIRLETEELKISATAVLAANGGGGGGGGGIAVIPGIIGEDGKPSIRPALGGANGQPGTSGSEGGGNGGATPSPDSENYGSNGDTNGISPNSGGGGGGGVGIIQLRYTSIVQTKGSQVSPLQTLL